MSYICQAEFIVWTREENHMFKKSETIIIIIMTLFILSTGCLGSRGDDLEERPENHGDEGERLVEPTPIITIAEGEINSETGRIDMVILYIDLYGNEGVDMGDVALNIIAKPSGGNARSQDLNLDPANVRTPTANTYACEEVDDPLAGWEPTGSPASFILAERSKLKITIDLNISVVELPPDSSFEVYLTVTTSGHKTYDYYKTPSSYPVEGVILLED